MKCWTRFQRAVKVILRRDCSPAFYEFIVKPLLNPVETGKWSGIVAREIEGRAHVSRDGPCRIEVQAEAAKPGYVVLLDTCYPGWRAWVDGTSVEIERANYLFKAVKIPAGRHEVLLRYEPTSFRVGAFLSLMVTFFVFALFGWCWGRRSSLC